MNAVTETQALKAPFFVKGKLVEGEDVHIKSRDLGVDFVTPELDLNAVITPRSVAPPLANVPIAEIMDFLVEAGQRLDYRKNVYLQECLELVLATGTLDRRIVENIYGQAANFLRKDVMINQLESNFGDIRVLDEWVEKTDPFGARMSHRAYSPRMVHMLSGNSPLGCVNSIMQGALVKAVNVFKMPSADPFTAVAVLRTMAEVDPNHPVVQSMSAIYWRGGDEKVERMLYRPQFFDRIVAWGGGDAINNIIKYLGPGIQLVSFDPKSSFSMIGREGFASDESIDDVAERAAEDIMVYNQDACLASRFIFVEGERAQVEKFCVRLQQKLGVDRTLGAAVGPPLAAEMREEIEVMQAMGDEAQVWGRFDGRGIVILSDRPVDFHPTNKVANVVMVPSLEAALKYVNVATQTIGVWPPERKAALREGVASAGGQRLCVLGNANNPVVGGPHDAMYPLSRFVHWMKDEHKL
jgi:hypothetical protein